MNIIVSALISLAVNLFGGWDTAFETLILFMGIDWFTGGVLLPVVFKKSPKSKSGTLESRAKVKASVIGHGKSKKIVVYKYKAKKNERKTRGHRQPYTKIQIEKISTTAPRAKKVEATEEVAE